MRGMDAGLSLDAVCVALGNAGGGVAAGIVVCVAVSGGGVLDCTPVVDGGSCSMTPVEDATAGSGSAVSTVRVSAQTTSPATTSAPRERIRIALREEAGGSS